MFKRYLLILIASTALLSTTGCSLFKSDSEEDETVAEETTSEEPTTEGEETTEVADADEEEVVDEYPDDDYGDSTAATDSTTTETTETTVTTDTSATDTTAASTDALPEEAVSGNTDESLFVAGDGSGSESSSTTTTTETTTTSDSFENTTSSFIPVRKMKTSPYMVGGVLINRLYIAREGDTLGSVSEKIYGDSSRKSDLAKWNSSLASKGLNVGDKVYYASARNPTDNSSIVTYYEEAGIQPTIYTAKSGESIRKVSKQLLGHSRSWMEVWATNDVDESQGVGKWALTEGTQLRYWPSGSSAEAVPMTQASNTETQPEVTAPSEAALADQTSPPAEDSLTAQAPTEDLPPVEEALPPVEEPPVDDGTGAAVATTEGDIPPPADDISAPPAPPITPPAPPAESGIGGMIGGQDDSMMMAVLGGLLILAALILLIFIKRGRKKVKYG